MIGLSEGRMEGTDEAVGVKLGAAVEGGR